jgi:hypothetical protein
VEACNVIGYLNWFLIQMGLDRFYRHY